MRLWVIQHVTPRIWRNAPHKFARAIRRFADVEADSGWQALQIAQTSRNPKIKALFLKMAIEEAHHASLFRQAALELNPDVESGWPTPERKALIKTAPSLAAAVAEISLNEQSIFREFESYKKACPNQKVKGIFDQIAEDEASHGSESEQSLMTLIDSDDAQFRRYLSQAKRKRWGRNLSVFSRFLGQFVFSFWLLCVYFVVGLVVAPFAWVLSRRS